MNATKLKVLVVDDENDIAKFTGKILTREGFDVWTTGDGAEALGIFEKERPQIVIIDIHLGYSKIDGMQILEKVKARDKDAECIMVTRITDKASLQKAETLGARHYFLKPISTDEWLKVVKEAAADVRQKDSHGPEAS
jgi:two-component system, NtrC family, response regulator AtoC